MGAIKSVARNGFSAERAVDTEPFGFYRSDCPTATRAVRCVCCYSVVWSSSDRKRALVEMVRIVLAPLLEEAEVSGTIKWTTALTASVGPISGAAYDCRYDRTAPYEREQYGRSHPIRSTNLVSSSVPLQGIRARASEYCAPKNIVSSGSDRDAQMSQSISAEPIRTDSSGPNWPTFGSSVVRQRRNNFIADIIEPQQREMEIQTETFLFGSNSL